MKIQVTLKLNTEGEEIAEFIRKIGRLSDKFGCYEESWDIR